MPGCTYDYNRYVMEAIFKRPGADALYLGESLANPLQWEESLKERCS